MDNVFYKVEVNEYTYNLSNRVGACHKLYEGLVFSSYARALSYCDEVINEIVPENEKIIIRAPKITKCDCCTMKDITPIKYKLDRQLLKMFEGVNKNE